MVGLSNYPVLKFFCLWFGSSVVCVLWSYGVGKELGWDILNYHYYLPVSLVEGRLDQDFFAASIQSYLNPVGFLLFYFLVSSGLHSIVVGGILAVVHALNIVLLYYISERLLSFEDNKQDIHQVVLACVVGLSTVIFWQQVGTSFVESIALIPVLFAIYILLSKKEISWISFAALLFGVSCGLKLTYLIYAVPSFVLFFWSAENISQVLKRIVVYGVAGLLGFLVASGYWLYTVFAKFGNPFFPLFNKWFTSEYFVPYNFVHARFKLEGFEEYLLFPFKLATLGDWVYSEMLSPDIRFIALLIFACSLLVVNAKTMSSHLMSEGWGGYRLLASGRTQFGIYYLLTYLLWISTTANARYGLVNLILIGPIIVMVLRCFASKTILRISLLLLVLVQLGMVSLASTWRWGGANWTRDWYAFDVPTELKRTPALYLTVSPNTYASLVGLFHSSSSFINLSGQYNLPLEPLILDEINRLYEARDQVARTLIPYLLSEKDDSLELLLERFGALYQQYGFSLNGEDCTTIDQLDSIYGGASLLSCTLEKTHVRKIDDIYRGSIDQAMDLVEENCSRYLHPPGMTTIKIGSIWNRYYSGTDAFLIATDKGMVIQQFHVLNPIPVAKFDLYEDESGLMKAVEKAECSNRVE